MTNKQLIRIQLEHYLIDTKQRGNISSIILVHYCVGYYGMVDPVILEVIGDLRNEGWLTA